MNSGTAIGIARVIERVDADKDVAALQHFRPCQRIGKENGIARGNIGDWNSSGHLRRAARFRHGDIAGERRPSEYAKADVRHQMPRGAERFRKARGGIEFVLVPLAVIERQSVAGEAVAAREREAGGGIESAAQ